MVNENPPETASTPGNKAAGTGSGPVDTAHPQLELPMVHEPNRDATTGGIRHKEPHPACCLTRKLHASIALCAGDHRCR